MSTPYVGQIMLFGGNYAIPGWAFCNGQLLSISQYQVLFALIGTTYGGDGVTTFALPDLRGRAVLNMGQGLGLTNRQIGEAAGVESVTLLTTQIPGHNHGVKADTGQAGTASPGTGVIPATPVSSSFPSLYVVPGTSTITPTPMATGSIGPTGGGMPHENRMPSLAMNYLIALEGIFPTRN
jgi:microcystin-dependent protein